MPTKSPRYFTEDQQDLTELHPRHEQLILAVLAALPRIEVRVWAWSPFFDKHEGYSMIRVPGYDYALAWATTEQWQEAEHEAQHRQLPLGHAFAWLWRKGELDGVEIPRFEHQYNLVLIAVQNCIKVGEAQ